MRIYVASSWRNEQQPAVVQRLRGEGHQVYDFRNPAPGDSGFAWSDIDPEWKAWSPQRFADIVMTDPIAKVGFENDFYAMQWADTFVLVMPCGRSAHLELGWAVGARKRTCILLSDGEPELMYRMVDRLCTSLDDVCDFLANERRMEKKVGGCDG